MSSLSRTCASDFILFGSHFMIARARSCKAVQKNLSSSSGQHDRCYDFNVICCVSHEVNSSISDFEHFPGLNIWQQLVCILGTVVPYHALVFTSNSNGCHFGNIEFPDGYTRILNLLRLPFWETGRWSKELRWWMPGHLFVWTAENEIFKSVR